MRRDPPDRRDEEDAGSPSGGEAVLLPSAAPLFRAPDAISEPQLRADRRRLVLLYELGRQICAETEEGRVFDTVLRAVTELLPVERAFLAVLEGGQLVPRAAHNIGLDPDPTRWPLSLTMVRRVLEGGEALLTSDATQDPRFDARKSIVAHNIRSVLCCPLGQGANGSGLVYADNRLLTHAFSRSDLEFLRALSHFAFLAIHNARERTRILRERELAEARLARLAEELRGRHEVIGASEAMARLYGQARRVARSDVPVMLVGETGTGKEVFARLIHSLSKRSEGPFVPFQLNAVPATMIESELFGHEKGAFTGADRVRIGRFELASGGTLFLDEIFEAPLEIQAKLLRVLQERTFQRLGSNAERKTDVRVVCAGNRDPEQAVASGVFREDLYYRLNAVMLELPPLRDRPQDIEPLAYHFLSQLGSNKTFDSEAAQCLVRHAWPGNVRELRNTVEALDALADEPIIRPADLPERIRRGGGQRPVLPDRGFPPLRERVAAVEREHMRQALALADGKHEEAIRLLGISRAKYFERKKEYDL